MSDVSESAESIKERWAREDAARDAARKALAAAGFDGPYEIHGTDPFGGVFGGGPTSYAICLRCAAMVRLGDPEERPEGFPDGPPLERGIRLHFNWHQTRESGPQPEG